MWWRADLLPLGRTEVGIMKVNGVTALREVNTERERY